MEVKTIKATEIVGTNKLYIKSSCIPSNLYHNGKLIDNRSNFMIGKNETLCIKPTNKPILHYERNGVKMSVEKYQTKKQWYCDGSPDEEVLRVIANKKELEGFKPVFDETEFYPVNFEVTECIIGTGSKFIKCTPQKSYSDNLFLYAVLVREISIDEYNILKEKYSVFAKFETPDRNYLRFVKINNKFAFHDSRPFGDIDYKACYISLDEAKAEEITIRNAVRGVVTKAVFSEKGTSFTLQSVISKLDVATKCRTKKSSDELINVVINYIKDYTNGLKE